MSAEKKVETTGWNFTFFRTQTEITDRDLSNLKPEYKAFIQFADNKDPSKKSILGSKSADEIIDLINFVLEDKDLTSKDKLEVKYKYLLILLSDLSSKRDQQGKLIVPNFENLKLLDATGLLRRVIADETLSRNKDLRNLCFLLWLHRLLIDHDPTTLESDLNLINSLQESDIRDLLKLVVVDKRLKRNQKIRDQCLIKLLKKLTKGSLSETDPMTVAITTLVADIDKPEQEYTNTLCDFIFDLFGNSFHDWLYEKNYDKARVIKKNLGSTLCSLAKLKLMNNIDQLNRRDQNIFYECCDNAKSILEKKGSSVILEMSELIIFQISYIAEVYEKQLAKIEDQDERQGTEKNIDPEKIDREKKSAKKNIELANIVGDEIRKQLLLPLQQKRHITVKHLAEISGRFAQAIPLIYSGVDFNKKRKEIKDLLADSDTISGTASIRRRRYFLVCVISCIVVLGAGAGLFSPKGMEFLHTTPGVYATCLATIGPGTIFSMASFIYYMLNHHYFFSNPITRAMYDFFVSTFNFSEIKDHENAQKVEGNYGTPSGSPVKKNFYEIEDYATGFS